MFDSENNNREQGLKQPLAEQVVHCIGKRFSEGNSARYILYSIEDLSIASPNRRTYLEYLAKRIKEEYDIDVDIVNYVIKR